MISQVEFFEGMVNYHRHHHDLNQNQTLRDGDIRRRHSWEVQGGWEYEPDQRHAEIIVEAMHLQNSRGVSTPAEDEKAWEVDDLICLNIGVHPTRGQIISIVELKAQRKN